MGESSLRSRDWRWFFAGRSVATVGDQVSPVALAFAVLGLTRNPGALGLVLAAQLAPEALLVLVGGAVADRWDRRKLMIVTDVVRMVLQGLTAALLLTHVASVADLVVLQAAYGAATAFFSPTGQGFVNEIVAAEQRQAANSLNSIAFSVASIVGPAIGGLLVALGSPGTALAVDAATFAVGAVAMTRVRATVRAPAEPSTLLRDIRDGWHEFTRQTWVWVLVCFWGLYQATVLCGYDVLGPVVAQRHLGGAGAWAAVLTGRGVGSVIGGVVGLRLHPRRPMLTSVLLLLTDVPVLLLLAAHTPVAYTVLAGVFEGGSLSFGAVLWFTALQERVPERAQSRVFAYDQLGSIAMRPVGLVVVGAVAGAAGTGPTLAVIAAAHLLLMLTASGIRDVRGMTSAATAEAAAG